MLKREFKRLKNRFQSFFDPIGIVALVALFLIPALAVLNLSPISKTQGRNVLGVGDGEGVSAVLVGGIHDTIKEEIITFPTEGQIKYQALIIKREKGTYSKPVLQLVNYDGTDSVIRISGSTGLPSNTEVSVVLNESRYIIESKSGEPFVQNLTLPPASKNDLYLSLDTKSDVKFNDSVVLSIATE